MSQIQIVYAVKFTPSSAPAEQQASLQGVTLSPTILALLGLSVLSDSTAYNGIDSTFERTVLFDELPLFVENFPTDAQKKSAVENLFSLTITKKTFVPCTEVITLIP